VTRNSSIAFLIAASASGAFDVAEQGRGRAFDVHQIALI
jgi:hypothetical protein